MPSTLNKELEDIRNLKQITKLQFGIMSPEEIVKGSVCEVTSAVTYEGTEPKINGLFDPRMGVVERGKICSSCENNSDMCPGHFGHIGLAVPVFYFQYINTLIRLLRCTCFRCSKLLVDKSDPKVLEAIGKKTGQSRFDIVYKLSEKIKQCKNNDGCHILQPKKYERLMGEKIKEKNNIVKLMAEFRQEAFKDPNINKFQNFTPKMCYEIFRKMTDEDVAFLGFNAKFCRPEWLICTVLPVPPPAVRPSVRQDNNQRSEDDVTTALVQIVNKNNMIKQEIANGNNDNIDGFQGLLQLYIATHINNELPNVPQNAQRSHRPLKALIQRLKGKEGRFRGNIMGKRCDYTARTVISVEPNISIDEFGIPYKIAMTLTFPEIVTKDNIDDMYAAVRNGPDKYPGAKSVRKEKLDCFGQPAPCTIYLKNQDVNKITLVEGDIVNRHLIDGDICLFNRQPSLHKMSMMAHKIRVLPQNTFRLNVTSTTPYNAD